MDVAAELAEAADRNAAGRPERSLTEADQFLADLATILQQLEDDHAPLGLKYQMASKVLIGKTFESDRAPFQDFMDLIRVRDDLVHPRHRDRTTSAGHVEPRSRFIKTFSSGD